MQRYDSYKDSGVDWLGEIPGHWEMRANRVLFQERNEPGNANLPILSVSLHTGVSDKEKDDEDNARTRNRIADKTAYRRVRCGDVAYNMMRAWQGAIGAVRVDGMVSPAYVVAAPRVAMNPDFFEYQYRTDLVIREMDRASKGITDFRKRLYWNEFKQMSTIVPPRGDQDRIVAFLDQKTAEIDAAIAKKERLIELLQEQKSILINQAVTRGLNPDVPLRDSGVEWIGQIPAHWKTTFLKHVSLVQSGVTLGKNYGTGPGIKAYPYLRVANVQDGFLDLTEITEIRIPVQDAQNYMLKVNDLLVTEGGDIDKLGRGSCWHGEITECIHQNHVFAVRVTKDTVDPEFISLITGVDFARRYFTTTANKTTNLASTNKTKLGNLPLLLPSLDEQKNILAYCTELRNRFDEIFKREMNSVSALKNMSAALIASAVTGKIKV